MIIKMAICMKNTEELNLKESEHFSIISQSHYMSTQHLTDKIGLGATYLRQQLVPPSYSDFNAQLPAPPSNLELKLPAPQLPGKRAVSDPNCSVLQVNPANIDNVSFGVFLRNSEQNWLHSSPQNKRSLANVKDHCFFLFFWSQRFQRSS